MHVLVRDGGAAGQRDGRRHTDLRGDGVEPLPNGCEPFERVRPAGQMVPRALHAPGRQSRAARAQQQIPAQRGAVAFVQRRKRSGGAIDVSLPELLVGLFLIRGGHGVRIVASRHGKCT